MNKRLLHFVIVILMTLFVSACGTDPCNRDCDSDGMHCKRDCGSGQFECVEGDDWGYPKVWVPAGTRGMSDGAVQGDYPDQSAFAINSGQDILSASTIPLVITTGRTNQWTSWFAGSFNQYSNGQVRRNGWDGGRVVSNRECFYKVTNGSPPSPADAPSTYVFPLDLSPSLIWANNDNPEDLFYLVPGNNHQYYTINSGQYFENNSNNFVVNTQGSVYYTDGVTETSIYENQTAITNNQHNNGSLGARALYANSKAPCYFRHGFGLYVGLAANSGGREPLNSDVVLTFHIPDAKIPGSPNNPNISAASSTMHNSASSMYSEANQNSRANRQVRGMDGYLVRGMPDDEFPGAQTGDRLFFKIVDRYYDDNEGGYLVKIKEGTRSPGYGPIETVINFFTDPVRIIMQRIYAGIVANQDFLNLIRALLGLYIVFYGFKWMIGLGGQDQLRRDAVVRMFKVGIIVTLISPGSWVFFHDHLFAAFLGGIMEIAGLLLSPFATYDPAHPWYSMDLLLARLFSGETWAKISSTLFSNFPLGIIFILVLFIAMILFLIAIIKAVVVYLIAFIASAILISLAPIFFTFMLFDVTKDILKEWFDQLLSFAIQQLILMAALGMFAAMIVTFMEQTIGYNVCWNIYADFDMFGVNADIPAELHLFDFRFWMPDISKEMGSIWMDLDGDGVRGLVPPEMAFRYIDLPYFDPVVDKDTVAKYMSEKNFLQLIDIVVLVVVILLMLAFMDFVPTMSENLKGGGSPIDTTSAWGSGAGKLLASMTNTAKHVGKDVAWALKGAERHVFKPGRQAAYRGARSAYKYATASTTRDGVGSHKLRSGGRAKTSEDTETTFDKKPTVKRDSHKKTYTVTHPKGKGQDVGETSAGTPRDNAPDKDSIAEKGASIEIFKTDFGANLGQKAVFDGSKGESQELSAKADTDADADRNALAKALDSRLANTDPDELKNQADMIRRGEIKLKDLPPDQQKIMAELGVEDQSIVAVADTDTDAEGKDVEAKTDRGDISESREGDDKTSRKVSKARKAGAAGITAVMLFAPQALFVALLASMFVYAAKQTLLGVGAKAGNKAARSGVKEGEKDAKGEGETVKDDKALALEGAESGQQQDDKSIVVPPPPPALEGAKSSDEPKGDDTQLSTDAAKDDDKAQRDDVSATESDTAKTDDLSLEDRFGDNASHYKVLGVDDNATKSEIRKAFKKLALAYHTDKWKADNDLGIDSKEQSEEIFKKINEAHRVLSDEDDRKKYDDKLVADAAKAAQEAKDKPTTATEDPPSTEDASEIGSAKDESDKSKDTKDKDEDKEDDKDKKGKDEVDDFWNNIGKDEGQEASNQLRDQAERDKVAAANRKAKEDEKRRNSILAQIAGLEKELHAEEDEIKKIRLESLIETLRKRLD